MIIERKLDKRIRDFSDVQTAIRFNDELIGEKGYFTCDLTELQDLTECTYSELAEVDTSGNDNIFRTPRDVKNGYSGYSFFIPEKLLQEVKKKYRAFTSEEFLNLFDTGKLRSIRQADVKGRYIITDIYFSDSCGEDEVYVCFDCGECGYDMKYLLENEFEYFDGTEWKTFGIGVEE